jgi:site-specific recombinase XerD
MKNIIFTDICSEIDNFKDYLFLEKNLSNNTISSYSYDINNFIDIH